ncbi:L-lysine exporter family protein LysE/ArgO [Sedimentibacter acidaminivorans]|jgi:L-lysine exporter family protein LysE/ArgO|uniref:L-lysine exporter family protein LysE/ArgO n=1 Tax=Sedimentibacter acidaminivorans TaxID=913099 RepID=A0ABS4G9J7_9FIRM|nr:LysE family transporter [Sedimentibacter acidaminivorans]MBP1924365.1 L-lysine exporter family protein LysE/ArgO [Sedimentibacter acidaminivorans]
MVGILIKGFTIGIAYVAPIGMQNLYVINTAMTQTKTRLYLVALITIFFDISLALACFFGMGAIIEAIPIIKLIILGVGSIAVIWIGIQLIRSTPSLNTSIDTKKTILQVTLSCLMVTWANPQALIDGTLLFGSFRASLPVDMAKYFIIGSSLASIVWFLSLGTIVSVFKKVFNEKALKIINVVCGIIIIYYGFKLGINFFQEI